MIDVTVLSDEARRVRATLELGHVLVDPDSLPDALGWELKPEGLCRDDVCVPVRDPDRLTVAGRLDLIEVAAALDRPMVVAADEAVVAVGEPRATRRLALEGHRAPDVTLPDLDGTTRSLSDWHGRKRLLFAFASW